MKTKYSCYEYEVYQETELEHELTHTVKHVYWMYRIYEWNDYHGCEDYITSDEWYPTEDGANQAAEDHIDRLENGEQK